MTPEVCLVKVDKPIDIHTFDMLIQLADDKKKERILRQRIKQNADNMLVGVLLAKYMLKKYYCIPYEKQTISYNKYGKPHLRDYPGVHYNISHSGRYVVCAVSDKPVGVDIQEITAYNPAVAKRIFSSDDIADIENSSDRAISFTTLWAKKEAYLKKLGCGITNMDKYRNADLKDIKITSYDNTIIAVAF